MKRFVVLSLLACLLPWTLGAQSVEDDLYYIPSKNKKEEKQAVVKQESASQTVVVKNQSPTMVITPSGTKVVVKNKKGNVRDVDEYNRRYSAKDYDFAQQNDTLYIEEKRNRGESGEWVNGFDGSEDDYEYATRIIRFRNPRFAVSISSPYYWDIVYGLNSWEWNVYTDGFYAYAFPTFSNPLWWDWRYGYYGWGYPYYGYGFGWTGWYGPSWHWGWHNHYYHHHYYPHYYAGNYWGGRYWNGRTYTNRTSLGSGGRISTGSRISTGRVTDRPSWGTQSVRRSNSTRAGVSHRVIGTRSSATSRYGVSRSSTGSSRHSVYTRPSGTRSSATGIRMRSTGSRSSVGGNTYNYNRGSSNSVRSIEYNNRRSEMPTRSYSTGGSTRSGSYSGGGSTRSGGSSRRR